MNKQNWKEEFEVLWDSLHSLSPFAEKPQRLSPEEKVLAFISKTLEERDNEIIGILEGMRVKEEWRESEVLKEATKAIKQ